MRSNPLPGLLAGLFSFALLATANAQVSPRENRTREGNHATFEPFSTPNTPFRWLQVHDDVVGPVTINSLSFRPDEGADVSGAVFLCDIVLSAAPTSVTAGNLATSFAACHGANRVQHRVSGSFPPSQRRAGMPLPREATMTLTLPAPFALANGERLVWQIDILQRSQPGTSLLDGVRGSDLDELYGTGFGDGCAYSNQVANLSHAMQTGRNVNGINVTLDVGNAPASGAAAFWFGTSAYLPPIALDLVRAPGCWLHVTPELSGFGLPTNGAGLGSLNLGTLPMPTTSFNLYSQAIALAPAANQLGLITSNGYHLYYGLATGTPPVGSLTEDRVTQTQPVQRPHEGLVVRFQ